MINIALKPCCFYCSNVDINQVSVTAINGLDYPMKETKIFCTHDAVCGDYNKKVEEDVK